jgi:prepilin-type N-terminal cleavage/methylation domain-containing protein
MNILRQKESEAGFSLLEMLVVLAIASVLFAITFWSLNFQQLTTQKQASMANIYDNQRFAVDTVTRYARMASYNVNQPKTFYHGGVSGSEAFLTHDNSLIRGTDQLTIRFAEDDVTCTSLKLLGCDSAAAYANKCPGTSGEKKLGINGTVDNTWAAKTTPFDALIVDPLGENSSIVQISSAANGALFVDHLQNLCPNTTDCMYPKDSMLVPVTWKVIQFRLDYDLNTIYPAYVPVPGHPRLVMIENATIIPLATDVEDFQIACAIDKTGDGNLDDLDGSGGISESDYVSNVAAADQRYIRAVRISMSFRSSDWVPRVGAGYPPAIEDHTPSGGNADGYMRKTISTRIKIRNMAQPYR